MKLLLDIVLRTYANVFSQLGNMSVVLDDSQGIHYMNKSSYTFMSKTLYNRLLDVALSIGEEIAIYVVIPFLILFIVYEMFWEIADFNIGRDVEQMRLDYKKVFHLLLLILVMSNYGIIARQVDSLANTVVNTSIKYVVGGEDNLDNSMALSTYVMNVASSGNVVPLETIAQEYKKGSMAPKEFYSALDEARVKKQHLKPVDEDGNEVDNRDNSQKFLDLVDQSAFLVGNQLMGIEGGLAAKRLSAQLKQTNDAITYISNMSGESLIIAAVDFICSGIQWVVRTVIELISWLLSMLVLALFPLAVLSYGIPGSVGKSSLTDAVSVFFQYKMWILVIAVFDLLYSQIFTDFFIARVANTLGVGENAPYEYLMIAAIGIVFTILFIAVPQFTGIVFKSGRNGTTSGDISGAVGESSQSTYNAGGNVVQTISRTPTLVKKSKEIVKRNINEGKHKLVKTFGRGIPQEVPNASVSTSQYSGFSTVSSFKPNPQSENGNRSAGNRRRSSFRNNMKSDANNRKARTSKKIFEDAIDEDNVA